FVPEVLCLLFLAVVPCTLAQCPKPCECIKEEDDVIVDCGGEAGSTTGLTTVPSDFPPDATGIYLSHQNISTIEQASFRGLVELNTLYLFNNRIKNLAPDAFADQTKMKTLDLSYNQLSFLKGSEFAAMEDSLEEIFLGWNPWHCGCELLPFRNWVIKMSPMILDLEMIVCATPKALYDQILSELSEEDMGC
uniref:LRRCT domain-containing protein n=1 Tax=Latimeria chalumnae TaxID=7897 RepID=H2ZWW1_LATCH